MKKLILNHKSYLSYDETTEYIKEIKKIKSNELEIILFPSVQYLGMYKNCKNKLGAQNFYSYNYGSYTGEVNLESLKSMDVDYTLIGHSERLKNNLDNFNQIKEKLYKSLNAEFNTILCVGEQKLEKKPLKFIKKELDFYLKNIETTKIKYLKVAYEPSWAIGSGNSASLEEINKTIAFIKKYFIKKYNIEIEVYYGGSVSYENINDILALSDGVLIGKKSSEINEVKRIIEVQKNL